MENVLIVIYLIVVIAMIGVILLQRSEGGGLGMGGGGNSGLVAPGGSGNILTRTTAILATLFFATAIGLTVLSQTNNPTSGILDSVGSGAETEGSVLDTLNALQGDDGLDNSLNLPAAEEGAEEPAGDGALPVPDVPAENGN